MKCSWCDSTYATSGNDYIEYNVEHLAKNIEAINCKHITITGGEPLLQASALNQLLNGLNKTHRFSIETNGSVFDEDISKLIKRLDVLTISPKLALINKNAEYVNNIKMIIHNKSFFTHPVLKFVYESNKDLEIINGIIKEIEWQILPDVYLMPEGKTFDVNKYEEVIEVCKEYNFKFSPRLQNIVWGPTRGV
jgi:7-carboxy-7-deazaguanine synthase